MVLIFPLCIAAFSNFLYLWLLILWLEITFTLKKYLGPCIPSKEFALEEVTLPWVCLFKPFLTGKGQYPRETGRHFWLWHHRRKGHWHLLDIGQAIGEALEMPRSVPPAKNDTDPNVNTTETESSALNYCFFFHCLKDKMFAFPCPASLQSSHSEKSRKHRLLNRTVQLNFHEQTKLQLHHVETQFSTTIYFFSLHGVQSFHSQYTSSISHPCPRELPRPPPNPLQLIA